MHYRESVKLGGRLHFLDALRGLAALAVMIFHFHAVGVSPIHDELAGSLPVWLCNGVGQLFCGVDVFFVLSGFVIAFSMDGNVADWRYAGTFILRRSLRLDPPYWTAMALMLTYFLVLWPERWFDFYQQYSGGRGILANLFYVQNLSFVYPAASILDVSWTLCLEVQFYLAYLLMLVLGHYLARRREQTLVVVAVALVGSWSLLHWLQTPSVDFTGRAWTFFLGVGVYLALTRGVPVSLVVLPVTALGVMYAVKQEIHGTVTVVTALGIYFAGRTSRLATLWAWRPLLFLGKISYSLYLLHMVVGLNLLSQLAPLVRGNVPAAWLAWLLAVGSSLVAAMLLHRFVEAPSNRLSQRLKRRRPTPAPCPAAVVAAPAV